MVLKTGLGLQQVYCQALLHAHGRSDGAGRAGAVTSQPANHWTQEALVQKPS